MIDATGHFAAASGARDAARESDFRMTDFGRDLVRQA
jgi:hypothetical protein